MTLTGDGTNRTGTVEFEDRERVPRPAHAIKGYEVIRELHRGSQGVVYRAIRKSTRRRVALKILLEDPYAPKSSMRRFEREIEIGASLKHANIISVFHSGETAAGSARVGPITSDRILHRCFT